jgi:hypothetical protein
LGDTVGLGSLGGGIRTSRPIDSSYGIYLTSHSGGIARMHDLTAIGRGVAGDFLRAEGLFVKLDRRSGVADYQVR